MSPKQPKSPEPSKKQEELTDAEAGEIAGGVSTSRVSIDVVKTPVPNGPVPIPYPN
jgi:hypothetical protein